MQYTRLEPYDDESRKYALLVSLSHSAMWAASCLIGCGGFQWILRVV